MIQKTELRFDERFHAKDDVDFSAQNLERFGKILVNNFLYPNASHHQLGSIGNRKVRTIYSALEAKLLIDKWPDICAPSKRSKTGILEEVRFK